MRGSERSIDFRYEPNSESKALFDTLINGEGKAHNKGDIVQATVVSSTHECFYVDVGLKGYSKIDVEEVESIPEIGDVIDVLIVERIGREGLPYVSVKQCQELKAMNDLESSYKNGDNVKGKIAYASRSGLYVNLIFDNSNVVIRAFLPGSLSGYQNDELSAFAKNNGYVHGKNGSRSVKKTVEDVSSEELSDSDSIISKEEIHVFKIIKIDRENVNVVISRRAVTEEKNRDKRAELVKSMKIGDIISSARVKNVTDYGIFVSMYDGCVDGLIHINDIAYRRVSHPSECVFPGEELKVKILNINEDASRISLGMKQLLPNPLEELLTSNRSFMASIVKTVKHGHIISAKIDDKEFVKKHGLEHVSGFLYHDSSSLGSSLGSSIGNHVSDDIEVFIHEVDNAKNRVSFHRGSCDDYVEFGRKASIGQILDVKITSVDYEQRRCAVKFCAYNGVDSVLSFDDLRWDVKIDDDIEVKIDDDIAVKVLDMDVVNRRIDISAKHCVRDTFDEFHTKYSAGCREITGKIKNVHNGKLKIEIDNFPQVFVDVNDNGSKSVPGEGCRISILKITESSRSILGMIAN